MTGANGRNVRTQQDCREVLPLAGQPDGGARTWNCGSQGYR
jgi:hypothetical protein